MIALRAKLRRRRGFTFMEILAAMLFMAIVIPAAMQGLSLASKVSSGATRKRHAAELVERVMNQTLVLESWRNGDERGTFGDEWPGYRWEVVVGDWSEDTMRTITATVYYPAQGNEQAVSLQTLASDEEITDEDAEASSSSGGTQ